MSVIYLLSLVVCLWFSKDNFREAIFSRREGMRSRRLAALLLFVICLAPGINTLFAIAGLLATGLYKRIEKGYDINHGK